MSAISGASSLQTLFANLQQATASSATSQTSSNTATTSTSTSSAASTPTVHGHHHRGGGGGKGLRSQIESAVESAISSAPAGSDTDQTIQTAVEGVLKQAASPAAALAASPDPTTTTDASQTSQPSFASFLHAHGVNVQQFANDLKEAFTNALGTGQTPDVSGLFSKLPNGSEVDVQA